MKQTTLLLILAFSIQSSRILSNELNGNEQSTTGKVNIVDTDYKDYDMSKSIDTTCVIKAVKQVEK